MDTMPDPRPQTIANFLNSYRQYKDSALTPDNPNPELSAARFALTGRTPSDDAISAINTIRDKLGQNTNRPFISRDFDSLIGFTRVNPVRNDIQYYPNPSLKRTLIRSVHVEHSIPVVNDQGDTVWRFYKPHTVPNVLFGSFEQRHCVRLFFPNLKTQDRTSVVLTDEELEMLYELAIRPTAAAVLPDALHAWPASFQSTRFRDRTGRGYSNASVIIPKATIGMFDIRLREKINDTPDLHWARHFFWGTEIRGVKDAHRHAMSNAQERAAAYAAITRLVNVDQEGTWYIDVGLEFMLKGHALIWSTHAHRALLCAALGISENEADAIVSNPRVYTQDISTHVTTLSGFRAVLDNAGVTSSGYIQVYNTDKAQTYNPQNGKYGKTLTPRLALHGNPPQWCQNLLNLYHDAGLNTDVAGRIEVRCPLVFAEDCLTEFPEDVIRDSFICYRRDIWWNFRACKLHAATHLLSAINIQPLAVKARPSTLMLVAGLVYQINSLHSRPDDSTYGRAIQTSIFPLTGDVRASHLLVSRARDIGDISDQYPNGLPFAPGGVMYLRDVLIQGRIRFERNDLLEQPAFRYLFGCDIEDVKRVIFQYFAARRLPPAGYVPQRKGFTKKRRGSIPAEKRVRFAELEDMAIVPADNDDSDFDDIDQPAIDEVNVGERFSTLVEQFASDIVQKLGNPRRQGLPFPSYSRLTQYERCQLSYSDINTINLGHIFCQVQWRRADEEEWTNCLKVLFPRLGYVTPISMKHLGGTRFYDDYKSLQESLESKDDADKVRAAVVDKVSKLAWLPAVLSDRLWDYRATDDSWTAAPHEGLGGPRIYINPNNAGVPTIVDRREEDRVGFRQEEEEDSDDELEIQGVNDRHDHDSVAPSRIEEVDDGIEVKNPVHDRHDQDFVAHMDVDGDEESDEVEIVGTRYVQHIAAHMDVNGDELSDDEVEIVGTRYVQHIAAHMDVDEVEVEVVQMKGENGDRIDPMFATFRDLFLADLGELEYV